MHRVDRGQEITPKERRAGVVRVPLDVLVHLGAEPDLHVLNVHGFLNLGSKVHGLVGGL